MKKLKLSKKHKIILGVVLGLCLLVVILKVSRRAVEKSAAKGQETYRVRTETYENAIQIAGTVAAAKSQNLQALNDGDVVGVYKKEGDHVKEGDLIVQLDDSEQQYRNYLKEVMRYAGTLSLQKESEVIPADELRVGDIICNDTHVVLIADEAVSENGEKCYLIGQSFIPAVCFHILTHTEGKVTSPWFTQEQLSQDSFTVGSFRFEKGDIRRWKEGF